MFIKKIITGVTLLSVIAFSGCGLKTSTKQYQMQLDVWGVFDNSSDYSEIFLAYQDVNDKITNIHYHKYNLESYKEDLLNALASGNGPDIFMIHNSWLPDFQDKIIPVPAYMLTEQQFRDTFVDVAAQDAVVDGQIYGVPMSVDSLALYYNKDIFNAAGIATPPKTWDEFNTAVETLTHIDEFGNFDQSAAAIGTAYNVNRSSDILTALMMQNGAEMSDSTNNRITFADSVQHDGKVIVPSEQALKYYTDFAAATEPIYTWNKKQNYSIDAFVEEQAAMMINYSWHYDTIKAKNAKLNFGVTDLPQMSVEVANNQKDFANYWMFAVAKNKKITQTAADMAVVTEDMRIHEAWQLLIAMTFPSEQGIRIQNAMKGDPVVAVPPFDFTKKYLEYTGKPAARRDIIQEQMGDVKLGAFARGNLIAQSWWRSNAKAVDAIFAEMIDAVNTGKEDVHDAIEIGASRTQKLMN
jgi:multiple sugar transport system substrate-binding protein